MLLLDTATGVRMAPDSDVHTIGTRVWLRDDGPDSWRKGEVLKLEGGSLVIKVEGGKQTKCSPDEAPIQNPETRGGVEVRRRSLSSLCPPGPPVKLTVQLSFDFRFLRRT